MKKKPGPKKITPYSNTVERHTKITYNLLSEKERRIYIATEAEKLPRGGVSYLSNLVQCSRTSIYAGLQQLKNIATIPTDRIRKKGGGRKPAIETTDNINEVFFQVIQDYTAGDPMDEKIKWTNLSLKQVSKKMADRGVVIGTKGVKKLYYPDWWQKQDNAEYVQTYGMATKVSQNSSYDAAYANAMLQAAQYVETYVKGMVKNYEEEAGVNDPQVLALTSKVVKAVANAKCTNVMVTKQETIVNEENRYQTFVREPHIQLRKIASFLGLDPDLSIKYIDVTHITGDNIGRGKSALSNEQKKLVAPYIKEIDLLKE